MNFNKKTFIPQRNSEKFARFHRSLWLPWQALGDTACCRLHAKAMMWRSWPLMPWAAKVDKNVECVGMEAIPADASEIQLKNQNQLRLVVFPIPYRVL